MISRKIELDIIKILACYLVIISHISCLPFFLNVDTSNIVWNISNLFYNARSSCVPLFLMTSGALYLSQDYEISFRKIGSLCIKMFIVYLAWNFMYSLFDATTINPIGLIKTMIFSPPGHLWYLPMLIGIYFLIPILKQISNNEKTLRYYLIFWFFISILKFTLMSILNMLSLSEAINVIDTSVLRFKVETLSIYSGYFLLGHYLYLHHSKLKTLELSAILIVSIIMGSTLTFWGTRAKGALFADPTEYMFVTSFLQSCSIYIIFLKLKLVFEKKLNNTVKSKIYLLSKLTFGVYLVHPFFTAKCYPYLQGMRTFFVIPLFALIIFTISAIISFVLKKIPVLNRYLF